MEIMTGLINEVIIIGSVLGLILFIKIWIMTNDVKEIKYQVKKILMSKIREEHYHYEFGYDTSYEAFENDIEEVEVLIFCEQIDEARYRLKRLIYNFNKEKQDYRKTGYGTNDEVINKMESKILELLKIVEKK